MKCAMCKREIRGRDYIRVSNPGKEDIYVHEMPCEWYEFEGDAGNNAGLLTILLNWQNEARSIERLRN